MIATGVMSHTVVHILDNPRASVAPLGFAHVVLAVRDRDTHTHVSVTGTVDQLQALLDHWQTGLTELKREQASQ